VELEIDGHVHELPPRRTFLSRFGKKPHLSLLDLRRLATEIARDPRPVGLLVTLRSFEGGMASAKALRDILSSVRKAGRRVVVYLPSGTDTRGYFVASAADAIYAFPGASIALLGFASRAVFVKGALAKIGLVADVLARGKYKSAGDALTRDEMSEPQREQTSALLDLMYSTLSDGVREGRGLTASETTLAIDAGIYRAPEAVTAKLVDAALFDDQVLSTLGGDTTPRAAAPATPPPPPPPCVAAEPYLHARLAPVSGRGRACIGVVRVHGAIREGEAGGRSLGSAGAAGTAVIAATRAARESKRVRGVILHVDSPGGSALASAQMHRELELLASEKPLVVAMANVAASGGYYVAAPAHAIIAEPVTITGSIGVIAARFALSPILERFGIRSETLKRGARADFFDPVRELSEADRAALMTEIEGTYQEFIEVVARGRKKSKDEIEALAQGRVWTGVDALAHGLVDQLGGFDVALAEVRRRVGKGGDRLEPRVIHAKADASIRLARPRHAELAGVAGELLGEWAEILPLALGGERVLLWEPSLMGLR